MNDKVYRVLEFDKIKELTAQKTVSPMGRRAVGEIVPVFEEHKIRDMLTETDEAVSVIMHKGSLPLAGIRDVKRSARYAEKGGVLSMGELLDVMMSLRAAREVLEFLTDDALGDLPALRGYMEVIQPQPRLEQHIDSCIESEEEMKDGASPLLRDIRRKITQQREAARSKINAMVSSGASRDLLQDTVVAMRDGRFVLPVKQENRAKFPGIIHDRSATGATLFIEPQAIVNINNEIRELELKEKEEIRRILGVLSKETGMAVRAIISNQKYLTRLDVIFAKAKMSVQYGGSAARVSKKGIIDIRRGRHPLLDPEKAVPLDITCGKDYRTLVITGPNTGGKTVTLKTVGLMMLMHQSGMHIPAGPGTYLPIMKQIFADIGDEQSIEQSLSTFSSHMKNIVEIIGQADNRTLVLLDELGAGTDPTEGAALAIAVLDWLKERGCMTFATTHYSELKKYAISTEGVENASMEFNVETLSPTYRLTIGTPGKSNAFEISKKLGLDEEIIDYARNLLGTDDVEFERIISAIEEDRTVAEAERDRAMTLKEKLRRQEEELERRKHNAEERRKKMLDKARQEAFDIVAEAREFAEDVKKELRELQIEAREQGGAQDHTSHKQQIIRRKLREKSDEYREVFEPAVNAKPASRDELAVGDRVNLVTMGQKGTVASLPDDRDNLFVQVGNMKLKVKLSDITKIDRHGVQKTFEPKTNYSSMYTSKTMNIETSINVVGKVLDDAIMEVDKYLDDAYLAGLAQVTIIHGRGTGTLRRGLQQLCRKHAHVAEFHTGEFHEGGEGVTVVSLKQD
ncbi:MAG: endonuclease MutS2 [Anaerovoracaceae bacterium]